MSNYIKYPRTPHLPWSPSVTSDDVRIINTTQFKNRDVIVSEKMDGENTSLYHSHCHARSLDSRNHPSRDWIKRWHSSIAHDIPEGWRICGENLYAQHSVAYKKLNSYFYGFSLWNADNNCLSWRETKEWFQLLGIHTPAILYEGQWDEKAIRDIYIDPQWVEGYVVRLADQFAYDQFSQSVAKWVRPNHVQTDQHWMQAEIKPNGLLKTLKEMSDETR